MSGIWWHWQKQIYCEILRNSQALSAKLDVEQMISLNSAEKNPGRRCVVNMNKHAIKGLSWVVLSHPAYSPELDTLG